MAYSIGGENRDYRFAFESVPAKIPGSGTNIPLHYDLSEAPAGFWTHVKADGGDMIITRSDGATRQALEIVFINTGTSNGEIHFKASSLSSVIPEKFYLYYGNAGASQPARDAAFGIEEVWSSGEYHNVFHFQSKTGDTDSTSYQNDWLSGSGCTLASGKLPGQAMSHNGSTDYGTFPSGSFGSNSDLITVEMWHKSAETLNDAMIFGGRDFASNQRRFDARVNYSPSVAGSIQSEYYDNDTPDEEAVSGYVNSDVGMQDDVWQHVVITFDNPNDTIEFYIDGVNQTTVYGLQETPANFADFTFNFFTGAWNNVGVAGLFNACTLDEFRLSTILRDQTYITTAFNNQDDPSAFWTTGAEEAAGLSMIECGYILLD